MILFEDEFSLSNTATLSYAWSPKGVQPLVNYVQKKRERQTTFGSINIRTGKITISFSDTGNYKTFKRHLKKVLWEYRDAPKIIMFLDNVRYHHAKLLKKYLEFENRLELIYLPAYSPDLNPIERVWWYMRKRITHNRYLLSLKERKDKFWKMFSHFQKPNEFLLNLCNVNY